VGRLAQLGRAPGPIGGMNEEVIEKSSKEQLLELVILISILAVFFISMEIIKPKNE